MTEEWRPICGEEGLYEISDLGRVRSVDRILPNGKGFPRHHRGKIMTTRHHTNGYLRASLRRRRDAYIHRLVAEAFLPNPNNLPHVNHLNFDRKDNRRVNLEWESVKGNADHSRLNGRCDAGYKARTIKIRGSNNYCSLLNERDVVEIRSLKTRGAPTRWLSEIYQVSTNNIRHIIKRESWTHV